VDLVHGRLGRLPLRDRAIDEQADHLALVGPDLLGDDGELGVQAVQLERALGGVVVGQRDAVETELTAALDEGFEGGGAVR
jgi:hypothetical protein